MSNPNPDQSGLKPWPPGVSGNPKGRPKRPDLDALNRLIDDLDAEGGIARLWLAKALGNAKVKPDFAYFKLLIEHRNGLPARDDKLTAEHTGATEVIVRYAHAHRSDPTDAPPGPTDDPAE